MRALKYFGDKPRNTEAAAKFVASCFNDSAGAFGDAPGRPPTAGTAAVGMMAVAVRTAPTFTAGNPAKLFGMSSYFSDIVGRTYDVSADGRRFLMIKNAATADQTGSSAPASLVVVEHWFEELKARVPSK